MKKIVNTEEVLKIIYQNVELSNEELRNRLTVSNTTLWRILNQLKTDGWINCDKNQAIYMPFGCFQYKDTQTAIITNALAYRASKLVEPHDTVGIGGGSTSAALIFPFLLMNCSDITIISNSIIVLKLYLNFLELAISKNITLLTIGGTITKTLNSFGGEYADSVINNLTIDKAFFGTESIDVHRGFFTTILDNTHTEPHLISISQKSYMVAASHKFGRKGFFKWANWSDFSGIITDYTEPLNFQHDFSVYLVDNTNPWYV